MFSRLIIKESINIEIVVDSLTSKPYVTAADDFLDQQFMFFELLERKHNRKLRLNGCWLLLVAAGSFDR